jgi:DNA ligase-1
MKPQLAEDADLKKMRLPVWAQPKIDGVRGMNLAGTFTGRSLDPFKGFGVTDFFSRPDFIGFDGEVTLGGDPCAPLLCSSTTGALGRFKGVTEREDFHWWIFDLQTEKTLYMPYSERYKHAQDKVQALDLPFLHMVPFEVVYNMEHANRIAGEHLDAGFEGTIWRQPGAIVKQGRSDKNQQLWRTKPWADMEILVTRVVEGNTNTNEAKTNTLGRTERSSAKDGLVPNGEIGAVVGTVVRDFHCPFSGKLLFPKGMEVEAGSGEMTKKQAKEWFEDQTQIVGWLATIKHLAYGVKDKPRMGTFKSKRLAEDMSD